MLRLRLVGRGGMGRGGCEGYTLGLRVVHEDTRLCLDDLASSVLVVRCWIRGVRR